LEVGLGDPRVPVVLKDGSGLRAVLVLTKGVLVNNTGVARVVEERRSDPGLEVACRLAFHCARHAAEFRNLEDEPTTEVYATNFLRAIWETGRDSEGGGKDGNAQQKERTNAQSRHGGF
jgi:hypothetical protein